MYQTLFQAIGLSSIWFIPSVRGTPALIGSCPSALSNSDMGVCITNEENEAQACPICLSAWESKLSLDPPGGVHAPVQTGYFKNVDGTSQRAKEHKPSHCGKGDTLAPHRPKTRGIEMIKTQTPARRLHLAKESQCVKSFPLPTTRLYICIYYMCMSISQRKRVHIFE